MLPPITCICNKNDNYKNKTIDCIINDDLDEYKRLYQFSKENLIKSSYHFFESVCYGSINIIKHLYNIYKENNYEFIIKNWGRRLINNAVAEGHLEVVKFILNDMKIDPYIEDAKPLYFAVNRFRFDIVEYFLTDLKIKDIIDIHREEDRALKHSIELSKYIDNDNDKVILCLLLDHYSDEYLESIGLNRIDILSKN